jgi:hypothetical protein
MEFSLNLPTYLRTYLVIYYNHNIIKVRYPEVSKIVLTVANNCSAVSGSASTWIT